VSPLNLNPRSEVSDPCVPVLCVGRTASSLQIRLEEDRLCCLVVIGVKADGTKELLPCADGYRESIESWPACSGTSRTGA